MVLSKTLHVKVSWPHNAQCQNIWLTGLRYDLLFWLEFQTYTLRKLGELTKNISVSALTRFSLLRFKESRPSKSKWTAGFRRRSIWLKQSIVKWKVDMFDNWRTDRPAEWRVRVWGRCKTLLHGIEHKRYIWKWAIGGDGSKNIWCFLNKRDMHGRHPSSQHVRWHASKIGGKYGIIKGIPHGNRE